MLHLFFKILPLYLLIILGYFAGRKLNAKKETIASLLIYVITPFVIFSSVRNTELDYKMLTLPLLFFLFCSFVSLFFYLLGNKLFKDSTKNLLAFAAGTGNTGYFGVPVALEILGEESLGIMIICIMGFILFENSLGFYLTARGNYSGKQSFYKLLKLPTLYAFLLALIFNFFKISIGGEFGSFAKNFIGAYVILGMMLIGLGLSEVKGYSIDFKFLLTSFFAKFIFWPIAILIFVYFDVTTLKLFDDLTHKVMVLLSIVPLAANTVAFATELKVSPDKAALAVFLSTLIALVYVPIFVSLGF